MKMNSSFRFCFRKVICSKMMKSSSSAREARMLKKMIDRGLTKGNSKSQEPKVLKKRNLLSAYENEGTSKRMDVVNKVYMENIPEMVYAGDFGRSFNDLKIQISKVQISKDYNFLNIYYITKSTDTPEYIIDDFLKRVVKELQIRIGSLKLSRKIPSVRFINDIRLENEIRLENIFETIDLGKDFVPTHSKRVVTSDVILKPVDSPVMRQDVLGVDVAKIKQRILADILRFKAVNIVTADEPAETPEHPTKLIKFTRKDFFRFYNRRRIEELKRIKRKPEAFCMPEDQDESEKEYINEYEIECEDGSEYGFDYEDECEDEYENECEGEYEHEDECEGECEGEYEHEDECEGEYEHEDKKNKDKKSEGKLIS